MGDESTTPDGEQQDLFESEAARSLLDQLLSDSRLYRQSRDYRELLDFTVRLRNFAPFNAMLLHIQKPGLSYAASERDWRERFGRWPREGARPLLILWPFAPVALVYDVQDTEGKALPNGVACFVALGPMDQGRINAFRHLMSKKCIDCRMADAGDAAAGYIRVLKRAADAKESTVYRMLINRNHSAPVQFATITHELGHLFLGHLGMDAALRIPERTFVGLAQRELEAESVSYLVCARNNVQSKSEHYLSHYISHNVTIENLDIYQVMRAAGQVESLLALSGHTTYDKPRRERPETTTIAASNRIVLKKL
jgi:hypothetical protein